MLNEVKYLAIHKKDWLQDLDGVETFFKTFGKTMPKEMWKEHKELKKRLAA